MIWKIFRCRKKQTKNARKLLSNRSTHQRMNWTFFRRKLIVDSIFDSWFPFESRFRIDLDESNRNLDLRSSNRIEIESISWRIDLNRFDLSRNRKISLFFYFFLFLLVSTLNKNLCEMLYIDFDFALSQRLLLMFYLYFLRRIL